MTRAAPRTRGWAKAPDFSNDPERAARVHAATERDREHYLRGGMREIECRACHACVLVTVSYTHLTLPTNREV